MRTSLPVLLLALLPTLAAAQGRATPVATDSVFLRAQQLVNEGQGDEGRKLVDSVLATAEAGGESSQFVEALYWRAALAPTAAEAERDYRRLMVEFPLSRRAEDALITLAQLEMTRRDYALALRHLDRLVREHPESATLPRAHYWMGRVHLDRGDLPRGCASLASARQATPRSNVELHNQIEFHAQRCLGVDTAGIAASDASATAQTPRPSSPPAAPQRTPVASTAANPPANASVSPPANSPPTSPATTRPTTGVQFTVQIAALNTRALAEELRDKLRARGYDARVVGAGQLFRVRIGRYGTRAEAAAIAADVRQKGISRDAWVAEAEAR